MALWLAIAAVATSACPVERAHYTLRHHPAITAQFRTVDSGSDWPGGLVLSVHDRRSGSTSWWLPWRGGTDGLLHMASTTDPTRPGWHAPDPDGGPRPLGDRAYLGFDAAYDILGDIPRREGAAPAHVLFPDSAGSHDPIFPAKQFFDLTQCGK